MQVFILGFILMLVSCRSVAPEAADLVSNEARLSQRPLLMIANVENAFDGEDQGTEYPEFASMTSNWNEAFAKNKAVRVAKVFDAANCPEIIVSPEVENQKATDLIVEAAKKCNYKGFSANDDQKFPIGIAIFTSRSVSKVSKIDSGYRPHLRVDFADGLTVIGVHFKSQRDGGDELRAKAAMSLKPVISGFTSKRLIIAGDFNTETDLLAGTNITNCSKNAPPTHVYFGEWHRLDKIYSTRCGTVDRFSAPFLIRNDEPYRSRLHKGERTIHENEGYSDHLPLYMIQ